ncbi:hypothetical protein [Tsukamurella sp. 8J]|uniref:hypothetical protein n=1 Tax=Tsukamurella sp. 8J TaxID=3031962 RepID=UPI0023B8C99E|nr:hypothetical protein [Tsukamurella sp. 8J]MDF0531339.1 hypothetical protein [Tsukamurella sp. 8J]
MSSRLKRLPASFAVPMALVLAIVATLFAAFPARADFAALPAFRAAAPAADLATPAGRAVYALTGPSPQTAQDLLPRDFAAIAHYRPVLRAGVPAKPTGGCSDKGFPLPHKFMPICAAHDLGFDLLRVAAHDGHPLGPWARQALDAQLVARMDAVCRDSVCRTAAQSANVGLKFNTWRQFYSVPVYETPLEVGKSLAHRSVDLVAAAVEGGRAPFRTVTMLLAVVAGFLIATATGRVVTAVRSRRTGVVSG